MCSCPADLRWRRIVNSVTHTDYTGSTCLETDLRLDADDSVRRGSTEVGWAIGAGLELPLAARWALRSDGSYLEFGSETYRVNLSGNNSCGPGSAMTPCRYTVRNRLGVVRLGDRLSVRRIGYAGAGGCGAVHGVQICSEARSGIPTTNAVSEGPSN